MSELFNGLRIRCQHRCSIVFIGLGLQSLDVYYSFSHNHGSGELLLLKCNSYGRHIHFSLNHDYGRKDIFS